MTVNWAWQWPAMATAYRSAALDESEKSTGQD